MLLSTQLKIQVAPIAKPRPAPRPAPRPKEGPTKGLPLGRGIGRGGKAGVINDGRRFGGTTPGTCTKTPFTGAASSSEEETASLSRSAGTPPRTAVPPPSHARFEEAGSPQLHSPPVPPKPAKSSVTEVVFPVESPSVDDAVCSDCCIVVKGFPPNTEEHKVLDIIRRASLCRAPRLVGVQKASTGSVDFTVDLLERKRTK